MAEAKLAEAILGPVVNATVSKAVALASEQLNLAVGWKKDLKRFCLIMKMLGGLLQDADERHVTGHPHLRAWLLELKAVADEAEDVFETVSYRNLRHQVVVEKSRWKKVSHLFTPSVYHPLVFRLRMANTVKDMNAYLADISDWATRIGLQYKFASISINSAIPVGLEQTHSFLPSKPVGREEDVSQIVKFLMDYSSSSHDQLPVITIVGLPGLGKTTLARAVIQNDKIQGSFGKNVIWVCVSESFQVKKILGEILESITGDVCEDTRTKNSIIQKIQERLDGKKYLLVLDDVWNEERTKWEDLKSCLLGVSKAEGSRVLVTTRSQKVAELMSITQANIFHLKNLDENECWTIIQQRAFASSIVPAELGKIGIEIARKCNGLPLVASVIGGVLCGVRDEKEWLSIRDMDSWGSLEKENGILPILQLSFDRLPKLALKQCFAFCSIFPKDFVMKKEVLIQLWMAEGYLQPLEGSSMEMEEIGDRYFNDLLSYSLFQEQERDSLERIKSCKMHDLIHDLAQSVSKSETVILETPSHKSLYANVRHLNVIKYNDETMPSVLEDAAEKLHTLFSEHGIPSVKLNLRRLRVLNIRNASNAKELPKCFGKSKCLRYLDISGSHIEKLPKFITQLYNLQTLRFMNCRSLKLPLGGLENLINLRHIYFNDEERMPANLGKLTGLQTLPFFFVGKTKGRRIEELGSLSRLKGKLELCNLKHVEDKSEAKKAKLHEKAINELTLSWGGRGSHDQDVLEGLRPPSNMQILSIRGYGGDNLPSWASKVETGVFLFRYLVELNIEECENLKSIPHLKEFSCLRELSVIQCNELTSIDDGATSLQNLSLCDCPKLKSVSLSGLPLLRQFNIDSCEELSTIGQSLSASTYLEELRVHMCGNLSFLPSLDGLTRLKEVSIIQCNGLKSMPGGLSSCTALETLCIYGCGNLESFPKELKFLHSLVFLCVMNCPKLRSIPEESLSFPDSLKELRMGGFSEELDDFPGLSTIFHHFQASLEVLDLMGWKKLTQLPHQTQHLTALKTLILHSFDGVDALPDWLGTLPSLRELYIVKCHNLTSFPKELKGLSSLDKLSIVHCPKLTSLEFLKCLKKLKSLEIGFFSKELDEFPDLSSIHASLEDLYLYGWDKLNQVPHQIQHVSALKKLTICGFNGVEALPEWLGNLSSLESLNIVNCKYLKQFPSAEAMRRLSKLKFLYIRGDCPELEECTKGDRSEWLKISHIPNICLKGKFIQSEDGGYK